VRGERAERVERKSVLWFHTFKGEWDFRLGSPHGMADPDIAALLAWAKEKV
jgi:hypothetical protein